MKRIMVLAPGESPGGRSTKSPPTTRGGRRRPRSARVSRPRHSGATLSEVLISLMVMSVGVLAAAALIPISIIRSVQATQLTNGTIHRLNAEQFIDLFPQLVHNPDLANNTDPSAYSTKNYIVDPLGKFLMPATPVTPATPDGLRARFGNDNGDNTTSNRFLSRYSGSANLISNLSLSDIAYSPDTWQLFTKGLAPTLNAGNSITVGAGVDTQTIQSTLTSLGSSSVRIVLFSADGKSSAARLVTSAAGTNISWDDGTTTADDLPASGYGTIQRYRVEFTDPRYSWLLTVRKTVNPQNAVSDANVDVVIYHKRAFSAANEQCFFVSDRNPAPANPLPPGVTVGALAGDTALTLDLTTTNGYTPAIKPFLKRGGFLFDLQNAHWYRIVQYTDDLVHPVITLDRPLTGMIVGTVSGTQIPAILAMPGVVEVYPLGSIAYNPNNPP